MHRPLRRMKSGCSWMSVLGIALTMAALPAPPADAARYDVRPGEPNLVRFESKAPLESFDGKTREVSGYVDLEADALADSIDLFIEVDLASLDTGLPLRNQHMRENHLETSRYPKAVFRGGRLSGFAERALQPGTKVKGIVQGVFSLHGVDRTMEVPVEVTRQSEDGIDRLRIKAAFAVKLADHGIARPQFLVLKLDDTQRITVELSATRGS